MAAFAALGDAGGIERFCAHCATGRGLVGDSLADLNRVRFAPPVGALLRAFVGADGLSDSLALAKRLVIDHKGRGGAGCGKLGAAGEGYLRICFAQSAERIERAMGRLREGLRER